MARPGAFTRTLVLCSLALMAAQALAQHSTKTVVMHSDAFAVSGPVSEMPIMESSFQIDVLPVRPGPLAKHASAAVKKAVGVQTEAGPMVNANLGVSFSGVGANGFAPSDVNLAVGPNHIVQTVNVQFAVYDKTGTLLSGPTNFTTLFSTLPNNCSNGSSDPIVNYDRQADRWLISDVAFTGSAPFLECYAVSKTNDPTGAYFLYSFNFGTTVNDYDKVSVWPTASNSAYLSTFNLFGNGGATYDGVDLCGFDRTKALAGDNSAALLCSQLAPSTNEFAYLPSDMDGPTPPADGTPGLFLSWFNNNPGQLHLFKLTMNFSAGTTSLSGPTVISVPNDTLACGGTGGTCVPQLGTTQTLDTLGDFRLMYRFPVRHFADHDRAVANNTVAHGSQVAIRWYELFDPAGSVTLNQQGLYAPDSTYRWMGSMAEDQSGDIAIGYSASSSTIHPAIRFTGRVSSDASGTLEGEASILEGAGSQLPTLSRWGDYTALQVDPTDDCTFWYTNQYEPASGRFNWATNIASFKFAACGADFTWTGSGSHTVLAGQSTLNYTFHAAPAAPDTTFANTVTFACSFSPTDPTLSTSSCIFNPTSIAAGQSAQDVTLSIQSIGPNSGPGPSKPQLRQRADHRRRAPWLPFALPIAGVVFAAFAGRKVSKSSAVVSLCASLGLLGLLVACGGGGGGGSNAKITPPAVSVAINPKTAVNLFANETGNQWPAPQTQSYTATVSNTSNTAVTWTLNQNGTDCTTNPACGSLSATTGSPVTYTAPTAVPNPAAVTVKAISQADTTKSASDTVNILQPTALGSYTVTVTATEGVISHSQQVTMVVQ